MEEIILLLGICVIISIQVLCKRKIKYIDRETVKTIDDSEYRTVTTEQVFITDRDGHKSLMLENIDVAVKKVYTSLPQEIPFYRNADCKSFKIFRKERLIISELERLKQDHWDKDAFDRIITSIGEL